MKKVTLILEKKGRKWWRAKTDRGVPVQVLINEVSKDWEPGQTVQCAVRWETDWSLYGKTHLLTPLSRDEALQGEVERKLKIAEEKGWIGAEWAREVRAHGTPAQKERLEKLLLEMERKRERREKLLKETSSGPEEEGPTEEPEGEPEVTVLVPESLLGRYPLGVPLRFPTGKVVVLEREGRRVRITDDHPSTWGHHLLGYEGRWGVFLHGRPATPEEVRALEEREAEVQEKRRKRKEALAYLENLWREVATASNLLPYQAQLPSGERVSWGPPEATLHGMGSYLILEASQEGYFIYALYQNSSDGDDWSRNNSPFGIIWGRPSSPEEHARVREALETLRSHGG